MKAVIGKNGKLFGKVSVIDLIIIVVIVGLAASWGYRAFSNRAVRIVNANTTFYATVSIERIRDFSVQAIQIGDIIYERYGTQPMGKVVALKVEPARDIMRKYNGTAVYAEIEDKYNLYVTLEINGSVNDNGYFVNGNAQLSEGSDVSIQSNMIMCGSRVYKLSTNLEDAKKK